MNFSFSDEAKCFLLATDGKNRYGGQCSTPISPVIIYCKCFWSFYWLRAKGEIVICAWYLPKFGVENKYTTL